MQFKLSRPFGNLLGERQACPGFFRAVKVYENPARKLHERWKNQFFPQGRPEWQESAQVIRRALPVDVIILKIISENPEGGIGALR
jgi:hypothetical protein